MEWLINNKILFLIFLQARSLRTWCQYGQVLRRTLSQVARSWLLTVSSHGRKSKLDLSPHFIRLSDDLITFKNLTISYHHIGGCDFMICNLGRDRHSVYSSLEPAMRDYLWDSLFPPASSFLRRLCIIYFCFSLLPFKCLFITNNNYLWEIILVLSSFFYFPPRKEKKW